MTKGRRLLPKTRCMRHLAAQGWTVADVERQVASRGRRVRSFDCFGADLLAINPTRTLLVQATALSEYKRHVDLLIANPDVTRWLVGQDREFELWCWRFIKRSGWTARVSTIDLMYDGDFYISHERDVVYAPKD